MLRFDSIVNRFNQIETVGAGDPGGNAIRRFPPDVSGLRNSISWNRIGKWLGKKETATTTAAATTTTTTTTTRTTTTAENN